MLTIKNLHAKVSGEDKVILKGVDLSVKPGEVHAIMGPNGAGKSTLAYVLSGHDGCEITEGEITFLDEDLNDMEVEERAAKGLFLAFQYPVEIPGISNRFFLQTALNSIREQRGESPMDLIAFDRLVKQKLQDIQMPEDLLNRSVNVGFSGGEKKRNDVFQMAVLEPKLAILDETDSGLDIDALRVVAEGINKQRSPHRSFLVITHYQRLLNYIKPDVVHVMQDGKIVRSGDFSLALHLEKNGYKEFES